MYISPTELVARLRRTKGFNVERFLNGPKGLKEIDLEQLETETTIYIDEEAGKVITSRFSVRFSIWWTKYYHLEEQLRRRKGVVISNKKRYYSGSGTARKNEHASSAALREITDEVPELIELLTQRGVTLSPTDLDFLQLANFNGIDIHESSVYLGFESHSTICNVMLDISKYLDEMPWPDGRTSNDMGTEIPQRWGYHSVPLIRPAERDLRNFLHDEFPLLPTSSANLEEFILERFN